MRALTKPLLWAILAMPAVLMITGLARGTSLAMDLLHPSGELSIRLMILAMLPGPLAEVFGTNRFLRAWLAIRRNLGVAAFTYALLHLVFYLVDMGTFAAIVEEVELSSIWTGWLALALMVPPAAISFDRAMRHLGKRWQQVQYLVYAAFAVVLAHWLLLDWDWQPAAIHLAPLGLVWLLRAAHRARRAQQRNIA